MAREYSCLTLSDRRMIALLKDQKVGVREIARRLCRHHSTISRELCRNAHRSDEIDLYG
ncbi:helix-turn-helix domain-containing protein, partial [Acetobacter sp. DsW_063]|uniref:helix-turn-helix domain-containing protein n=1 Tax=Acetobacter sp. DsW_063 TaxID=1514894 RepID=UPI0035134494